MSRVLAETVADGAISRVSDRSLSLLWASTAGALALHNVEEWMLGMTEWIAAHPWFPARSLHGDQSEFAIVLAIISGAVLLIAIRAVITRPRWSAEVLVFIAYAKMVNGISHAVLSLLSWSLMPGVITGIIVLLPLSALVIHKLPPVQWTTSNTALMVITTVGLSAGAFVLASILSGT